MRFCGPRHAPATPSCSPRLSASRCWRLPLPPTVHSPAAANASLPPVLPPVLLCTAAAARLWAAPKDAAHSCSCRNARICWVHPRDWRRPRCSRRCCVAGRGTTTEVLPRAASQGSPCCGAGTGGGGNWVSKLLPQVKSSMRTPLPHLGMDLQCNAGPTLTSNSAAATRYAVGSIKCAVATPTSSRHHHMRCPKII